MCHCFSWYLVHRHVEPPTVVHRIGTVDLDGLQHRSTFEVLLRYLADTILIDHRPIALDAVATEDEAVAQTFHDRNSRTANKKKVEDDNNR